VGLPSKPDVETRTNWCGSHPNSAPFQTTNLVLGRTSIPTTLLTPSIPRPLLTPSIPRPYRSRTLTRNPTTSTTNQTTIWKSRCR